MKIRFRYTYLKTLYRKYNSSNKHLRHISESVRKFLIDKIAKERIEKK